MSEVPLWNDWRSAEAYREYVESHSLYPSLNRRLARLARLSRARRVLDLGCGTGATTAACLELLPRDAEILGVDGAATMVEIARTHVRDPRARFLLAEVHALSRATIGSFDRATSNAALWLFPRPREVLSALGRLLLPEGILVFNLPAERIQGAAVEPDPFQLALAAEVRSRLGEGRAAPASLFERRRIEAALDRSGFRLEKVETYSYFGPQKELMELMRLPVMAGRLCPGLSLEEALDVVQAAADRSDPDLVVEVPWVYFVARASQGRLAYDSRIR